MYTHGGTETRIEAPAVFLCAGSVETPRLMLMGGIGGDHVGRHLTAHPGLQIWGRFDTPTRPFKGIPGGLISEDMHRPADADFAGGYLLQSIGVMPVTYARQVARGRGLWGQDLREHMRGYGYAAGINILGECLPNETSRITLSDETDARGLPKPHVTFDAGENEQRMTRHAEALMRQIWDAAGARDVWAFPRHAHVIGTARMGADAGASVVDADGRVWDTPGLIVSDNSTFPSSLPVKPRTDHRRARAPNGRPLSPSGLKFDV